MIITLTITVTNGHDIDLFISVNTYIIIWPTAGQCDQYQAKVSVDTELSPAAGSININSGLKRFLNVSMSKVRQ